MSSFLWLLLYLAPLLGLTAAVFGWFGWQWRGRDMQQRIKELEARLNEARPQEEELPALRDELKSAQIRDPPARGRHRQSTRSRSSP
jgi:hypothetical protein